MAQVELNPAIAELNEDSWLYTLYNKFYNGMKSANEVDAPDYVSSPVYKTDDEGNIKTDEEGVPIVDEVKIKENIAECTDIQMKNSAYMLANAIFSTISQGGSGTGGSSGGSSGGTSGGNVFVAITGDTMTGALKALYGFEAGYDGTKIFEVFQKDGETEDDDKINIAKVTGELHLDSHGLWINEKNVLWHDNDVLCLDAGEGNSIQLNGDVTCLGTLRVGDLILSEDGFEFADGRVFYHSGNSNKEDVDWTMHNGTVAGDLSVAGMSTLNGGLTLSQEGEKLLLSQVDEMIGDDGSIVKTPYLKLYSDLSIVNNHGIKFDDNYIIFVKGGANNVVSFSAPGKILNLGDKGVDADGNELVTNYISLQTGIRDYEGSYTMVSENGDGNFPNSFSAGVANGMGRATMQTYYKGTTDCGVTFFDNVRFGSSAGPSLYGDDNKLNGTLPYSYAYDGMEKTEQLAFSVYYAATTSLFTNPVDYPNSATLHFNTDAEFFAFDKPIEAEAFQIKSEKYKTKLAENVLFFGDSKFIEGVTDGIRYSGNSYFDGSVGSIKFSSGFAGSGWKIYKNELTGNICATFDELTVRKKMRVYELEVQKISATNGSLWVSDSCSGDLVEEILN